MNDKIKKWYINILLSILFSALTYILLKIAFSNFWEINPSLWMFYWILWSIIIISPFFAFRVKNRAKISNTIKSHWKILIFIWFAWAVWGSCWATAMKLWWVGPIWLLSKSDIVFTFLLWIFFLNEKINSKEILWLVVAIIWFWFIAFLKWEISILAVLLIVWWKAIVSFQSFFAKKYAKDLHWHSFAFIRMIFAWIFYIIFAIVQWEFWLISLPAFLALTSAQLSWAYFSRVFYFESHNYLDISKLNTFMLLTPVTVIIMAYFIFWDQITLQKIIWSVLIIWWLSIFIINRPKK